MASWYFPPLLKAPVSRETIKHIHRWVADEDRRSRAVLGDKGMGKTYRQKALEHMASLTPTKTIDGEKHYLLHRTMGKEEFGIHVKGGLVNVPERRDKLQEFTNFTSWAPSPSDSPYHDRTHVVSAWVPESHVSFYPLAYKEKFEKMFPLSDANRFMEDEREAIVKPGKFRLVHSRQGSAGLHGYLRGSDLLAYHADVHKAVNAQS
jgi:hypothetical protein